MTITTATITQPKQCNFCSKRASYDFRTLDGRWAYGCISHYREHRMHSKLGTGMGQLLLLAPLEGEDPFDEADYE